MGRSTEFDFLRNKWKGIQQQGIEGTHNGWKKRSKYNSSNVVSSGKRRWSHDFRSQYEKANDRWRSHANADVVRNALHKIHLLHKKNPNDETRYHLHNNFLWNTTTVGCEWVDLRSAENRPTKLINDSKGNLESQPPYSLLYSRNEANLIEYRPTTTTINEIAPADD